MNLYPLPPLGSGIEAQLNIFQRSPVAEAAARTGDTAPLAPRTPDLGPNKIVSQGIGDAKVGVIQSVDTSQAEQIASDISANYQLRANSTGGATGVQPVQSAINALANLHNGVADLSGFSPL